ncbi:MAG: nitrate reductase [Gammaproteobacteria bacterium]|nr:nitrate reductase [Gammaproteobacteria bacterium]
MVLVTALFAFLFYAATALLLTGLTRKIIEYWRAPSPLKIPTPPAPTTRTAVIFRMGREIVFFESLFRSDKWTWVFSWLFHLGLFLVVVRHLRYFTEPVWGWVALLQPLGKYGAFAMVGGLAGLWARRLLVDRVRYISKPSDHLMLALLAGITGSGLVISYVTYTDIVAVKIFCLGLIRFDWGHLRTLPADFVLFAHLLPVIALMAVFPFSKLLHAPALFFSPTLNQVDNARKRRHLAPWAAELDSSAKN